MDAHSLGSSAPCAMYQVPSTVWHPASQNLPPKPLRQHRVACCFYSQPFPQGVHDQKFCVKNGSAQSVTSHTSRTQAHPPAFDHYLQSDSAGSTDLCPCVSSRLRGPIRYISQRASMQPQASWTACVRTCQPGGTEALPGWGHRRPGESHSQTGLQPATAALAGSGRPCTPRQASAHTA